MNQSPAHSSRSSLVPREDKSWAPLSLMTLFLFKLNDGRQYCLSRDPTGRNIPTGLGGARAWRFVRRLDVLPEEVREDFDPTAVAAAIAQDGYSLIGCPFRLD